MIDYSALQIDIEKDAGNLASGSALLSGTGFVSMAGLVAAGEDTLIANLYNHVTSSNSIPITSASTDTVIHAISSQMAALLADIAGGVNKALKYGPLLQMLQMLTTVDFSNAYLQTEFASLATDGYLTAGAIAALTTRAGSRAEEMFGAGTALSAIDVARAFGRGF